MEGTDEQQSWSNDDDHHHHHYYYSTIVPPIYLDAIGSGGLITCHEVGIAT